MDKEIDEHMNRNKERGRFDKGDRRELFRGRSTSYNDSSKSILGKRNFEERRRSSEERQQRPAPFRHLLEPTLDQSSR